MKAAARRVRDTDFQPGSMTSQPHPLTAVTPPLAAALACAGVGLVWYTFLMPSPWAAAALSPICGHAGTSLFHCADCYAALAVTAAGVLAALARLAERPRVRQAA